MAFITGRITVAGWYLPNTSPTVRTRIFYISRGPSTQLWHGINNTPLYRFQAIRNMRQSPVEKLHTWNNPGKPSRQNPLTELFKIFFVVPLKIHPLYLTVMHEFFQTVLAHFFTHFPSGKQPFFRVCFPAPARHFNGFTIFINRHHRKITRGGMSFFIVRKCSATTLTRLPSMTVPTVIDTAH